MNADAIEPRIAFNKDLDIAPPAKKTFRKPVKEEVYTFIPTLVSNYKPESPEKKIEGALL